MKPRVALITHSLSPVGGLSTMISFLHEFLKKSSRYDIELISLATSVTDQASARFYVPSSWIFKPVIEDIRWHNERFNHAGARGSELEFQRYKPRRNLTDLLNTFDLLQFVVGSAPWVCVAEQVHKPKIVWTATTTRADRESRMNQGSAARRAWSSLMVRTTEKYERRGLLMADAVLALSEYTRESLGKLAPVKNIRLAPCGIDTSTFRPGRRQNDYILSVARFSDARKNVRLLFEAYWQLSQRLERVPRLYLIGDPPSEKARRELDSLGLQEQVVLLGPKRGDELAQLYREANFFVLSSDEEGLGIVILEAMASGLPVVSTACGGPESAIVDGETGYLTPVGDAAALATAMERLITDKRLAEQMGARGREIAEARFSLDSAGQLFLDEYERLLHVDNLSESNQVADQCHA
jgi:glycosyltransferase involved in cell wall biosynthesis